MQSSSPGETEWVNGADASATMVPAFRDHLGPPAAVARMLERYWVRPLLVDERTTRRIDHVRCDPGYADATCAFHRSVEECLVLAGSLHLDGEGDLRAGDYFWRPAGFVHSAQSPEGFECLLMMEGDSPGDGSGAVTREVRDVAEAGTNALHPDDWSTAIGPRGWPRHVSTELLAAGPAPSPMFAPPATARCLSFNPGTGAGSYLVRAAGSGAARTWSAAPPPAGTDRERIVVVLRGDVEADGERLAPHTLLRLAVSDPMVSLETSDDAELLVKVS